MASVMSRVTKFYAPVSDAQGRNVRDDLAAFIKCRPITGPSPGPTNRETWSGWVPGITRGDRHGSEARSDLVAAGYFCLLNVPKFCHCAPLAAHRVHASGWLTVGGHTATWNAVIGNVPTAGRMRRPRPSRLLIYVKSADYGIQCGCSGEPGPDPTEPIGRPFGAVPRARPGETPCAAADGVFLEASVPRLFVDAAGGTDFCP